MDQLVSLEALVDVSISAGFSFGVVEAKIMVDSGQLLGKVVSRDGTSATDERAKAERDFRCIRSSKSNSSPDR